MRYTRYMCGPKKNKNNSRDIQTVNDVLARQKSAGKYVRKIFGVSF